MKQPLSLLFAAVASNGLRSRRFPPRIPDCRKIGNVPDGAVCVCMNRQGKCCG